MRKTPMQRLLESDQVYAYNECEKWYEEVRDWCARQDDVDLLNIIMIALVQTAKRTIPNPENVSDEIKMEATARVLDGLRGKWR